ncbi:TATA box-binding protein-like 1 [Branchiostoma floridae x Branchiostoma japonicum]
MAVAAASPDICQDLGNKNSVPGEPAAQEQTSLDIDIANVVCSFRARCHLNLRMIALNGANVIYKRELGKVTMKLRRPYCTANIWSSGKIVCTGARSEDDAKKGARRCARTLQNMGFQVHFSEFKVVNVLGICAMPFTIKITLFSKHHKENASYEPELHPGVTYKIRDPKAVMKIFSTGSITCTAPCVANIQRAIEHIYPLVHEFRGDEVVRGPRRGAAGEGDIDDSEEEEDSEDDEEDD